MCDTGDDLDYLLPANCPSPYFDTWDRHNSIAFSATKGLRNAPGENNCFVNCAVQVFWHLDVFRRSYRRLLGHTCMGNSCIFCALKVIFTQFQYSDKTSLHPDALRKALAETFANQQRFQLGHMDDAAECFENILRRIHFHIARNFSEDACTAPHCLPHQKFSMSVYEKVVCPCGASSSPLKFSEMVHYVSASALVAQSRMMQENGDVLHPDRFGLLLRKASAMGDVRNCPAGCGKQVQKQRTLLNIPDVLSVGLVWDSDHPSVETTTEVAAALGTAILLQDMYHRVMPDIRILPRLQLVAVVCYYGKHYSTFVFHSKLHTWIYFDDATVREIGPQWENVVEKCRRGRFQPLLLLYANPSATPISVDTAPRKRVMAPGFAPMPVVMPPEDSSDSGLDRTQESIKPAAAPSMRRSVTPSHDLSAAQDPSQGVPDPARGHRPITPSMENVASQENGRDSPARLTREHTRQPSFLFAVSGKNDKNKHTEGGDPAHLPGGASGFPGQHVNGREHKMGLQRTPLDGGASFGRLDSTPEEDYSDYTLSGGDQYRRPSLNGFEPSPLPLTPNASRYQDAQRKESFNKRSVSREGKSGADIVRYQVDANRAVTRTPDFSKHGDGYSPQKNGQIVDSSHVLARNCAVGGKHPRHNSLSGREEEIVAANMDYPSTGQHVVVKPKPTGHSHHDVVDGSTHTPVSSGLATLPRKKGLNLSEPAPYDRQSSKHQEANKPSVHYVEPPLPPGTPPPTYDSVVHAPDCSQSHSRQTSTSSQASTIKASSSMGQIEQSSSNKKSDAEKQKKKVKKEKKSDKDPVKKLEKKKSNKSDLRKCESAHDLTDPSKYINPRMVESILKHQGVHRQNSSCSVSSNESDSLMNRLMSSKAGKLTVDIPYDNVSLGSHKDSGYGSSDRNSSSSTGSGTIDPYTQYFISKSMVVPRSVNQQALEQYHQYGKGPNDQYIDQHHAPHHGKDASGLPQGEGRKIMHPIKESSQEDFLKMCPNDEPIGTQKFITAPVATQPEPRPPPVPPKNFAQFHVIKSSSSAHQRESSLDSLDKDDTISEHFVSLCKKADSLMDNCMLAETREDITASLCYCESALGCLKEAMAQKNLNSKALAYVQKKHNSCLLKSRSLQKRMPAARQESNQSTISSDIPPSVGNRSSITSSDSDMSDHLAKQLRLDAARERQNVSHERQGSSSAPYNGTNGIPPGHRNSPSLGPQEKGPGHQRTDSGMGRMPNSHSANYLSGDNSGDGSSNTADLYGTLPRNKSRKPSSDTVASPEVYQSFLNKQKCLQAGVHSSQQSLDSLKSDSGGSDHSSANGSRMSKSEIRQLLQENIVQRQWAQSGTVQPHIAPPVSAQNGDQPSRISPQQSQPPHQMGRYPQQGQYPSQQQQYGQYPPQQQQGGTQYAQYQGAQFSQQHQRQGPPHRHNTQPVPPSWQQQQQQQQHYPPPPPSSQQQQHYPQQNHQQQTVSTSHPQSGQPSRHPSSNFPPPPENLGASVPPLTSQQNPRTAPPPVPGQKPSIPYPSSVAKSRTPGPPVPDRPDAAEVGKQRMYTQNVARVAPNAHIAPPRPAGNSAGGGSYLVMMTLQQQQQQQQQIPPGSQMRHATSSMHLSGLVPAGTKPLERCASQPDCQKLVDSAYPANLPDAPSSVYSGRDNLRISSGPFPPPPPEVQGSSVNCDSLPHSRSADDVQASAVSVRALASRFETSDSAPTGSRRSSPHQNVNSDGVEKPQRTRSKSESLTRKPKSVLKNKKNKNRQQRKSVTFGDSVTHYTDCDEPNSGYESARELSTPRVATDDRAYYSDDEERLGSHVSYSDNELDDVEDSNSSNSDESPLSEFEPACQLCHKRRVDQGKLFCAKCSFYMGRLKSS